jgi:hypothetical protein
MEAGDLAKGEVKIANRYDFINPKDFVNGRWTLQADGKRSRGQARAARPAPARKARSRSRCPGEPEPGVAYWLDVSFASRTRSSGHRPATRSLGQFKLRSPRQPLPQTSRRARRSS